MDNFSRFDANSGVIPESQAEGVTSFTNPTSVPAEREFMEGTISYSGLISDGLNTRYLMIIWGSKQGSVGDEGFRAPSNKTRLTNLPSFSIHSLDSTLRV